MKLIIRHKITNEIICEVERNALGIFDLSGKDLSDADLSCVNLRGANLKGACLRRVDLSYADLNDADLRDAYLSGACLSRAYLSRADLRGAYLRGANLSDASLKGANLKVYQADNWTAYIQPDSIRIGCEYHTVDAWMDFTDEAISTMDETALEYWKNNKDIIFAIHAKLKEGELKAKGGK